jgi:hypothetical protein
VFLIVGISHLKTMKIEKMMSNGQGWFQCLEINTDNIDNTYQILGK